MEALIIGAGPAGLTAALELLERTSLKPVVLEASQAIGGLSQTVNHAGNRMDIGGHRFFSKSDRVMNWWLRFLPLQALSDPAQEIFYQGRSRSMEGSAPGPDPDREDRVMLLRPRHSRIYYLGKLFPYPLSLSLEVLGQLGFLRSLRMLLSYLRVVLFPPRRIETLEDFFISRFGRELYKTFFKTYTEKVWGIPCTQLSAAWGAQRIKGLSITRAVVHALRRALPAKSVLDRSRVETSLIEQFLYPKFGPGQMWEQVALEVERRGGTILKGQRVRRLHHEAGKITKVVTESTSDGAAKTFTPTHVFSTMPIQTLVEGLEPAAPPEAREISAGLSYRDFLTVGLLLKRLRPGNVGAAGTMKDNWIYIHDPGVDAGRLQIFNNWSPYLVKDPGLVWVGVEYFCAEGDRLWSLPDAEMAAYAARELRKIGLIDEVEPLDSTVVRMPKAYPAYTGTYARFGELRAFLDGFENLFLIGRNGMHRYNNQDHSMLAAMTAVDNLIAGRRDRENLWSVNSEEDYHETKAT